MDTSSSAELLLGSEADLPQIYEELKKQFPSTELYAYKNLLHLVQLSRYRVLLYRRKADKTLIGYALVFAPEAGRYLWLDYIAILPAFQGRGWGGRLFRALQQKYCGPYDGILFSVEHVCRDNTELARRQKQRLAFYQKEGARRLRAGFLLPHDRGLLPMYLYFKPRAGLNRISREEQAELLAQMYDYCFFNRKDRGDILPRFRQTIQDESFCGK